MQNRRLNHSRQGMTLVELLVVAAIIVLLLAISVPILTPMLEARRTSNAAQVLAGVFQQARAKSIQEGTSYGVRLIPFETAPTAAVQLHFQKGTPPPDFVNPPDVRVRVESGRIIPYHFSDGVWTRVVDLNGDVNWNDARVTAARDHFLTGYAVQFNHLGRFLLIDDNFRLMPPYDGLNLPDNFTINDAMKYRVSRLATIGSTWFPPVVMPQGTIVDLVFSGGETVGFEGGAKTQDGAPAFFAPGDDVVVMFSPTGHVDLLYISGTPIKINEMLYFCVGEWDRQIDTSTGRTFAEDGRSNLEMSATFWVTLHPKTGGVRVTENSPVQLGRGPISLDVLRQRLGDARRFAREHFFNVGGR